MHAITCILEFMNFMLFLIKFVKFKQRMKFKKFELWFTILTSVRRGAVWWRCRASTRAASSPSTLYASEISVSDG